MQSNTLEDYHFLSRPAGSMARLALDATNYRVGLGAFLQARAQNILHCLKIPIIRKKLSEDSRIGLKFIPNMVKIKCNRPMMVNLSKTEVLEFIHNMLKFQRNHHTMSNLSKNEVKRGKKNQPKFQKQF